MDLTIRKIVDVHIRDENRKALKKLLAERRRLIVGLNALAVNYDTRGPVTQCEEDIAVIEKAIVKLDDIA